MLLQEEYHLVIVIKVIQSVINRAYNCLHQDKAALFALSFELSIQCYDDTEQCWQGSPRDNLSMLQLYIWILAQPQVLPGKLLQTLH